MLDNKLCFERSGDFLDKYWLDFRTAPYIYYAYKFRLYSYELFV